MAPHDMNNQQQQTWIPYEQAKDCSQGFCSIYCPQWCYIIFPPPPPFSFVDGDDNDSSSSSTPFSPLVIVIIGILASAFLLISYYTIISKYCGGFHRRRRTTPHSPNELVGDNDDGDGDGDDSRLHETTWHVSPANNGLDQALINKISVYKYKRGDGVVDGTDCSVCLSEFQEEDSLRLLPKCSHAFHLQCIDTWLSSHSNCPLCRASIVNSVPPQLPPPSPPVVEGERSNEMVVIRINSNPEEEEEEEEEESSDSECHEEETSHDVIEIRDNDVDDEDVRHISRSLSMDSVHRVRVSIGDILKMNMEDELMIISKGCSSSRGKGENSKGSLHCVMSRKLMKRSMSSGRLNFSWQGKGRNSVITI